MTEFQHLKEIDLAGNLLCNWNAVLNIVGQFPLLENFSVAHNAIRDINSSTLIGIKYDKLKILNLNNCSVQSFRTVQMIAEMMPNIESLCVAKSNLSDIEECDSIQGFRNLRELDCSGCCLDKWVNQVSKFATLPRLESWSLDDNSITSIPSDAGASPFFPNLSSLRISGTAVSTWMDLEGINSFLSLKALRFTTIPLTEGLGQAEVRSNSIARFSKLEYFNGSRISNDERREAERRYITLVSQSLQKANFNENEKSSFLEKHPTFLQLTEKYKNLSISLKNRLEKGGTLATSIYNVTIKSMAASSCTMEPVVRRLPATMTVERIKAMCSRIFHMDYDLLQLRFRKDKADSFPVEMDDNSKSLDYYGLCDGAEVLVDEVDLRTRELQSKMNDDILDERIVELGRSMAIVKNAQTERQKL